MEYIVAVIALLFMGYVAVCIGVFRFAFLRSKKSKRETFDPDHPSNAPWFPAVAEGVRYTATKPREQVCIRSRDGLALYGMLFTPTEPKATIILFHGYRSFPEHDFGGVLHHYLEERQFRVLMVDQRAHGKSEGKYITFGVREKEDCVDWTHYVATRFGKNEKILLDGMSMGATTVMMAAGEDLPENIVGIIADCGYTTPDAILRKVGREMRLPVPLLLPGVYAICRLCGFDPRSVSAPVALAKKRLPLLMVHGTADSFVPYDMGIENYNAAVGDKFLLSVEGADHGMSYVTDQPAVMGALADFFDKTVGT